jgi:hypothetical protein
MDWTEAEVKLIVEDYFNMLELELRHQPYNKSAHRRALLPLLNNRSEGAIEFKRQNISAALIKMELPFIAGYIPMYNYQKALIEKEIADYIIRNKLPLEQRFKEFAAETIVPKPVQSNTFYNILEDAPPPSIVSEREPLYKPIKTNYLKREQNNRQLGEQGEDFVIGFEKWRLIQAGKENLADKIEWLSKDLGDGLGYDILSKNENGTDRFIEVKTTKLSKETPIYISRTEVQFASKVLKDYFLYRVYNFETKPKLFIKNGQYESFCTLIPQSFKGHF